jgi:hypothetical protein
MRHHFVKHIRKSRSECVVRYERVMQQAQFGKYPSYIIILITYALFSCLDMGLPLT